MRNVAAFVLTVFASINCSARDLWSCYESDVEIARVASTETIGTDSKYIGFMVLYGNNALLVVGIAESKGRFYVRQTVLPESLWEAALEWESGDQALSAGRRKPKSYVTSLDAALARRIADALERVVVVDAPTDGNELEEVPIDGTFYTFVVSSGRCVQTWSPGLGRAPRGYELVELFRTVNKYLTAAPWQRSKLRKELERRLGDLDKL
jgi:hypothetical protein